MLPGINRIKKRKDFQEIFKNSKVFKNNLFLLRFKKNNQGLKRFGFIVSQKVSKKANVRNKIKRRLAEIIRGKIESIRPGTDLVITALSGSEKKEFSEIKQSVNSILEKCLNL